MKKVLLTLLAVIVIAGALAGAGFAGYQIGLKQGGTSSGEVQRFVRPDRAMPNIMPHNFGRDFGPRVQPFQMPGRGVFGIRFFSPFRFLWNAAVLVLIVLFAYWLFTKSGWQITRKTAGN